MPCGESAGSASGGIESKADSKAVTEYCEESSAAAVTETTAAAAETTTEPTEPAQTGETWLTQEETAADTTTGSAES